MELQNGKYELRLLTPQMAAGKKDIILAADVHCDEGGEVMTEYNNEKEKS